ncbi:RagB/SusD family nutrient uptake outer membrane protein [Dysgonomonas sp. BGC7]|uniref:RagB/SusD family nutrient uptake outer membrane protein n=1 Tax=Dysgonomonas sp. BGC7 TaxID=1658008 RepID=UPI000680A656|nr:RagB/SusD family nutrient uptake outer membrane protein [Dysgonomonas sp. BGC7]MBD8387266.1 RagB/SusD family nutrient uptake outer membrane protein [Dysgonomonas sp. BGC7]
MKKIIYLLLVLLGFSSCELIEEPKRVAVETFYNNAEEIDAAIMPIYSQLQQGMRRNIHTIPESQIDYGYAQGSYLVVNQFQGFDNTNINRMSDVWNRIYRAIRDANLVIEYAPKAKEATQDEIKGFVAEAKFMRAFCYFFLIRYWGDVPLRTEKNMEELGVSREPIANIYNFIIEDLEYAEKNLIDGDPKMWGRPTVGSAKTVLADVYLNMEKWKEARDKALEVIKSGKYSLLPISVSDDYYKIFGIDANGTKEEIFYLKYNINYGNEYAVMGHYNKCKYLNFRGNNGLFTDSVKNKFIKEWDYKDLRKDFNLYSYNKDFNKPTTVINGSKTTLFYKKFKNEAAITNYCGTDNTFYRYADLLLLYSEAECRLNNGPTDEAVEKLNMIHRRAYGYATNTSSPVDFKKANYSKDTFLDLILKERGYETFYEGKRFLDLKRMGKYEQAIMDAHGIKIDSKILLYPIPLDEINYNEALDNSDQNPGY